LVLIVAVIAFALSPIIYLGDIRLITLPLPEIIEKVWSIFRSTGRIFWPIYYLLVIGFIVYFLRKTRTWKPWAVAAFLIPLVFAQSIDIIASSGSRHKANTVSAALQEHHPNELNAYFMDKHCDTSKIILVDNSIESGIKMFHDLSEYIGTCQPTLTSGYFARFPQKSMLAYADRQRALLLDGTLTPEENTLYITQSEAFLNEIDKKYTSTQHGDYWLITSPK